MTGNRPPWWAYVAGAVVGLFLVAVVALAGLGGVRG